MAINNRRRNTSYRRMLSMTFVDVLKIRVEKHVMVVQNPQILYKRSHNAQIILFIDLPPRQKEQRVNSTTIVKASIYRNTIPKFAYQTHKLIKMRFMNADSKMTRLSMS